MIRFLNSCMQCQTVSGADACRLLPLQLSRIAAYLLSCWRASLLRRLYCDQRVCVSVCLSVGSHISKTTCPNFTQFSVHVSPVAVAQYSSVGSAVCYIFPVVWMTSCFHITQWIGQNHRLRLCLLCFVQFARWRHLGEVCSLWLHLVLVNVTTRTERGPPKLAVGPGHTFCILPEILGPKLTQRAGHSRGVRCRLDVILLQFIVKPLSVCLSLHRHVSVVASISLVFPVHRTDGRTDVTLNAIFALQRVPSGAELWRSAASQRPTLAGVAGI